MATVPAGMLPPDVANDIDVLTRKAGLTPWHARLLRALENISNYYDQLPAVTSSRRAKDA